MRDSPLRFHIAIAVLAVGAAALFIESDRPPSGPVVSFADPAITESSGLVAAADHLLTVNDSGSDPVVYVVDADTGKTAGHTTYAEEVVDVEALAAGPDGTLWVGDIGDNGAQRTNVAVYRLPLPAPGEASVAAERFELAYRNGPRDAETLMVHPRTGRLFVVSKGLLGGQVFAAPEALNPGLSVLRPVGRVRGMITDGAFLPDGRHAVLRSYSRATFYETTGWTAVVDIRLPEQPQGEGLAVGLDEDGEPTRLLLSSEGRRAPVLAVPLPRSVTDALADESPRPLGNGPVALGETSGDQRSLWFLGAVAATTGAVGLGVLLLGRWGLRAARRRGRSMR